MPPKTRMTPDQVAADLAERGVKVKNHVKRTTWAAARRGAVERSRADLRSRVLTVRDGE